MFHAKCRSYNSGALPVQVLPLCRPRGMLPKTKLTWYGSYFFPALTPAGEKYPKAWQRRASFSRDYQPVMQTTSLSSTAQTQQAPHLSWLKPCYRFVPQPSTCSTCQAQRHFSTTASSREALPHCNDRASAHAHRGLHAT